LAIATTGIAAVFAYHVSRSTSAAALGAWAALAPLRILLVPMLGTAFFLALLFAPTRSARRALLAATVIEVGVFAWVALTWWRPFR